MAASDKSVVPSVYDFSSDSTECDDWQELTKSDYAKVIFSDLLCNAASGTVECKFQITDNVHEDPNDYVGLFRIGYQNLSQCLASKMLSQTKCEDNGKLQRCVFTSNELPCLTDGDYQFLYVTRDQEVCGASVSFEIKMSPLKRSVVDSSASETMVGGFLLVNNETERKVKDQSKKQEKVSVQQSLLSEQKKEEIAAWVSQNPDYYLLIEQIGEQTFTIDALQESKDLAMKEVAQSYEILNAQNSELIQLKNLLAAYEEKIKISHCLQDEKEEELSRVKSESLLQEEKLKASLSFQDQQRTQINDLKKEVEELKAMQKAKECQQVSAEAKRRSIDDVIQKAQDLAFVVTDIIKHLNYTDEDEVEKFFQLKIQLLIMFKKMIRATDLANTCVRNSRNITHSVKEKDLKESSHAGSTSCAVENRDPVKRVVVNSSSPEVKKHTGSTSCAVENHDPVERVVVNTNSPEVENHVVYTSCPVENQDPVERIDINRSSPEVEKTDIPTSSVETLSLPSSNEKETANGDSSKEFVKNSFNKAFELEVLEHQITKLPRLNIINEDLAKILQADKFLDPEDIFVTNRLTEKIIKRGFNFYESIELLDDSVSDSGSDVSEVSSECCSSMKKELLCLSRVLETLLSNLSNHTSLDHLIVVEREEDRSLLHTHQWHVLALKCSLRYQVELLLEIIEKQKDGGKKVSKEICDLLAKCMLLKDEVVELNAVCKKLQSIIAKLKEELKFKNALLAHFHNQKAELECKNVQAEKTVEDFHARIVEASFIYKKQFAKIERLSKKLRKYKSVKDKTKSSKGESPLISDSSDSTFSFEVIKQDSVQNVNDSDTGEHMFEKSSLEEKNQDSEFNIVNSFSVKSFQAVLNDKASLCKEHSCNAHTEADIVRDKEVQAQDNSISEIAPPAPAVDDVLPSTSESKGGDLISHPIDDQPNIKIVECKSYQSTSLFSDFASFEHFQEIIKENFLHIKEPATLRNSQECSMSCYICKEIIHLGPEHLTDLMNHLENEHLMKVCPFCGQLFEEAVPLKYFEIHVEKHF